MSRNRSDRGEVLERARSNQGAPHPCPITPACGRCCLLPGVFLWWAAPAGRGGLFLTLILEIVAKGSPSPRPPRRRLLPPIFPSLPLPRPRLVQRRRVVEPSVDHGPDDLLGLADVLEGIAVDDDEVGELAGRKGPDVPVHAEALGAVGGGTAESLVGSHPPLDEHPDLPVKTEAFALTVGSGVD